jgi:hypothetical protein
MNALPRVVVVLVAAIFSSFNPSSTSSFLV